jgi:hypothetical protein
MEAKTKSRIFESFVETLDYLEVCRVTVSPEGKFEVPSERDGRIVQVSAASRKSLARFMREFADRLDEPAKPARK